MNNTSKKVRPLTFNVWTQTDESTLDCTYRGNWEPEQVLNVQQRQQPSTSSRSNETIFKNFENLSPPRRNGFIVYNENKNEITAPKPKKPRVVISHEHSKDFMNLVRRDAMNMKRLMDAIPLKGRMKFIEKALNSQNEGDDPPCKVLTPTRYRVNMEKFVEIGPNHTKLPLKVYNNCINYSCPSRVTINLLRAFFTREILATHTLADARAPVFYFTRPNKLPLNPKITKDIIYFVTRKYNVPEKLVKTAIMAKCFEEDVYKKRRKWGMMDNNENE